MGKIAIVFMSVILCFSFIVSAQTEDETVLPGTAPDSLFWGLDVAMDKISLALTRDNLKRAEKALEIAEERLAEVKLMVEKKKLEHSEKAKKEHAELLLKVEENAQKAKKQDKFEQLEAELELESKIEKHNENILKFESELSFDGELNSVQQGALDALLLSLGENVRNVQIKIRMKHERTKDELNREMPDSSEKVEELEAASWKRKAEHELKKAEEEIIKAERKIAKFELEKEVKFGLVNEDTVVEDITASSGSSESKGLNSATGLASGSGKDRSSEDSRSLGEKDDNDKRFVKIRNEEILKKIREFEKEFMQRKKLAGKLDSDAELLKEYGLEVPIYDDKSVLSAKKYVAGAKSALEESKVLFELEDYRQSYAFAKFARELADMAVSGDYLKISATEEESINAMNEENEAETEEQNEQDDVEGADVEDDDEIEIEDDNSNDEIEDDLDENEEEDETELDEDIDDEIVS